MCTYKIDCNTYNILQLHLIQMKTFNSHYELKCAVSNYFRNNNNCGEDIANWDTSKITDMSKIFIYCSQISNQPISLMIRDLNIYLNYLTTNTMIIVYNNLVFHLHKAY